MDHYERLKISRDAPLEVIRAAYRALAAKHHPDRHGQSEGANTDMAALNGAYEVLCDPASRANYDASLADPLGVHSFDPEPAAEGTSSRRSTRVGQFVDDPAGSLEDERPDINWSALLEKPAVNPWTTRRRVIPIVALLGVAVIGVTAWWTNQLADQMAAERALASHYEAANHGASQAGAEVASAGQDPTAPATPPSPAAARDPLAAATAAAPQPTPRAVPPLRALRHPLDGEPLILKREARLVDPLAQ